MNIGIDQLSFYTPHYYLELAELAAHHQIDPAKYRLGIGQERMAVAPPDEDIISMAANAAAPILQDCGTGGIDTVLFATETSIDQAKSAAVSVHRLLQLPANSRTIELKQACYSATAALQLACAHIARHPARKVIILAADIAKYDLDSAAEPTQGAAAVAMLISANPRLATIAPESGLYSEDIYDFWRPNHRKTPLVDGKYSTLAYLKALEHAWQDYRANGGRAYEAHAAYCYHLPFNKMASRRTPTSRASTTPARVMTPSPPASSTAAKPATATPPASTPASPRCSITATTSAAKPSASSVTAPAAPANTSPPSSTPTTANTAAATRTAPCSPHARRLITPPTASGGMPPTARATSPCHNTTRRRTASPPSKTTAAATTRLARKTGKI